MLKITALKPVRIYANFVTLKNEYIAPGAIGKRPVNTTKFQNLAQGQSVDNVSLFFGIDPRYLPDEATELVDTNLFVVPYRPGKNSQTFQDLVQVDEVKN